MHPAAAILIAFSVAWLPMSQEVSAAETESPPANGKRPPITMIEPPEQDFFSKQMVYEGLPIKASDAVVDEAFHTAHERLQMMLHKLPEVRRRLIAASVELHIIGRDQVTTDLPEWRKDKGRPLKEYGGLTRDERTRGMGGRLVSCGEENLLRLPRDRYRGRDICVHEFAHAIRTYGMTRSTRARFDAQYRRSLEKGRWKGSYAGSNPDEFFAELSMWHFGTRGDLSMEGEKPTDGRAGLKAYDPEADALFQAFYNGRSVAAVVRRPSNVPLARSSEGDQFLDGIGETALVARYILAGDTEDWSRNNHHASVLGAAEIYVDDEKFGRVLSLDGGTGGFLKIPGDALTGLDTVSVTGWVCFRSEAAWQRFFDFGRGARANLFCTPIGGQPEDGFRARITAKGWTGEQGPVSPRIALNRWVHLAVVLDAANRTLTIHADGKRMNRATGVQWTLADVLGQKDGDANSLFIGKSQYAADATANVKLHDIRIYAIALTNTQVSAICGKASVSDGASLDTPPEQGPERPRANAVISSMIYGTPIVAVADVKVETAVGHLPRLPLLLPAKYEDGAARPDVRVIWPAPKNNAQVLQPGTYTLTGRIPGTDLRPKAVVRVLASSDHVIRAPTRSLETFPLSAVTLNKDERGRDTPFIKNRDKFLSGLAATNPDSFLYMFRDAFGQEQPQGARLLAGWDSQTTRLRGHASGHYLSAIAQAYAGCVQDEAMRADFKRKMDYMVDVLYGLSRKSGKPSTPGGEFHADPATVPPGPGRDGYTSDLSEDGLRTDYWNWGDGFISAYPPDQFIMLEHGAAYGGGNHQVWAPYYTLHKILAGLLDCYEIGGNEKALKVANDMGLWVYRRLQRVPLETRIQMWNRYIAGEFGGMNEVLARLYRITDDDRFLQCAQMFDNIEFFFGNADQTHGLACNVDTIRGKHANQHIPQITGALEVYRSNREPPYFHIADNFWHMCGSSYMYLIGGVAGARRPNNAECFTAEPDSLFENGFSPGGQNETCATYNLLKLSRQLFMYSPAPKYMDYYEQALYNHILASVAEKDAGNTYHVPLNPGARKRFGNAAMNGFTCCNGTALESSTKLQDSIYFKSADNGKLYVNLFIPSTLYWEERGVTVTQSTSFPYSDRTRISLDGAGDFAILIRVPQWASSGMYVSINGQRQLSEAAPGEHIVLNRRWKSGDTIHLQMPISFRLGRVMDQPNIAGIFYGPVLLAVQEPGPRSEWRKVKLNARNLSQSIEGDASALRFTIGELHLKPFFETYGRYSVYLDITSE